MTWKFTSEWCTYTCTVYEIDFEYKLSWTFGNKNDSWNLIVEKCVYVNCISVVVMIRHKKMTPDFGLWSVKTLPYVLIHVYCYPKKHLSFQTWSSKEFEDWPIEMKMSSELKE